MIQHNCNTAMMPSAAATWCMTRSYVWWCRRHPWRRWARGWSVRDEDIPRGLSSGRRARVRAAARGGAVVVWGGGAGGGVVDCLLGHGHLLRKRPLPSRSIHSGYHHHPNLLMMHVRKLTRALVGPMVVMSGSRCLGEAVGRFAVALRL